MSETDFSVMQGKSRGNWIRLRTIILLRWFAIIGQLSALLVADYVFELQLQYAHCYFVVGISVIGNVIASFIFPESKRLNQAENLLMVLFDMLQLAALLYLTGGLHNPFSILIVGPVTVSAAALTGRSTIFMGSTSIVLVTVLVRYHLPIRTMDGAVMQVSELFLFGQWMAVVIAVIFLGLYSRWIATEMHAMSDALAATQMALAREQKLTDLGGVVAAAAHELGTPLATIKLTSAELMEDLEDPEQRADAALIRQEADRCRDILRAMGRAGRDDLHLRRAPLPAVIDEAADPHRDRGKEILFDTGGSGTPPVVFRQPELIHGLRNLVQNAVDFAQTSVWIDLTWTPSRVILRIMDDGPGYPPHVLSRIGDPFVRSRAREEEARPRRPGYEGMGLGLFIAKTLLERTGAELSFANAQETDHASQASGAVVELTWPRGKIEAPEPNDGTENPLNPSY